MADFEKIYQKTALRVIERCHGGIRIKKHGKIIAVYDPRRHIWSDGLAGLIIREECKNANLRDWEIASVRGYLIQKLLEKTGEDY